MHADPGGSDFKALIRPPTAKRACEMFGFKSLVDSLSLDERFPLTEIPTFSGHHTIRGGFHKDDNRSKGPGKIPNLRTK